MKAVAIYLICCSALHGAASSILVSGTVFSSSNKHVRGSIILHDLSATRVSGQTPFDRQFASKADGSFSLNGVPPGKYEICVDAPHANVLNPCIWSTPTVITVGTTPVENVAVKVDTGYTLRVKVNDPQSQLPAPKGGTAGQALLLSLITRNNRFLNLDVLPGPTPGSRDH